MKLNKLTMALAAIAMVPTIALSEGSYTGDDFYPNAVKSREIKDGTIEAQHIAEESMSLEDSTKIDLGEHMSFINLPMTTIYAGSSTEPNGATLFSDSNFVLRARCFKAVTTLYPTIDIYPEQYATGSVMRGEDSVTSLSFDTLVTAKQIANVAATTTTGPKLDGERNPIHFVALDGTIYYIALAAAVNPPGKTSYCRAAGYIYKITPEATPAT